MSCFSSLFIGNIVSGEEHEVDVAIDVINEDKLRIGCLICEKEVIIHITKEQFDILDKFQKDMGE